MFIKKDQEIKMIVDGESVPTMVTVSGNVYREKNFSRYGPNYEYWIDNFRCELEGKEYKLSNSEYFTVCDDLILRFKNQLENDNINQVDYLAKRKNGTFKRCPTSLSINRALSFGSPKGSPKAARSTRIRRWK